MKKEKILVIEDDNSILGNIVVLLQEEDYIVFSAKNGLAGLELARSEKPDLILCDILMQGIDGYEVLEKLQLEKVTRTIPFIFVTAKVEKEDLRKGMQIGADDYIFKPFGPDELLAAVETRLKKRNIIKADLDVSTENEKQEKIVEHGKILIKVNGTPKFIKVDEIVFISAERQYSSLRLMNGKSIVLRKPINAWEKILPVNNFMRIHRSTMINTDFITKIEKHYNSSYLIFLRDIKEHFNISKRYSSKLRDTRL